MYRLHFSILNLEVISVSNSFMSYPDTKVKAIDSEHLAIIETSLNPMITTFESFHSLQDCLISLNPKIV